MQERIICEESREKRGVGKKHPYPDDSKKIWISRSMSGRQCPSSGAVVIYTFRRDRISRNYEAKTSILLKISR